MKTYITFNDYCKKTFGTKVYKLSLSASDTCPNRDGTRGTGGCIFCSRGGSGEFAANLYDPIKIQIENAKKFISAKAKDCKYIAYFQSFSGTYGDINALKEKYYEALECEDIVGISIATRPDCLSDDVMRVLTDLSKNTRLFIELGLQTANDNTAELINRCYPLSEYDKAIEKLRCIDVHIVTHIILGLPFEDKNDMLNTVRYVSSKTDGIKFHLLYVVRGTELEKLYLNKRFQTLSLEEYADILADCIEILPDDTVIHRMTGDGAKRDLIAPIWSADKKRVLAKIENTLKSRGIFHRKELQEG